jgi:heat shock protein HslJ
MNRTLRVLVILGALMLLAAASVAAGCSQGNAGPSVLAATSWEVTAYRKADGTTAQILEGTRLSADFSAEGRVSGSAGCNRYFASYTVSGDSISIDRAGATRKFCTDPNGVMEQETMFLNALTSSTRFRLSGKQLELLDADGAVTVALTRVSSPM